MLKVMVTGCGGYIGCVLCQELINKGFQVLGVDSFIYNNQSSVFHLIGNSTFDLLQHDVRDVEGLTPYLSQADVVIPLAALVGAPVCEANAYFAKEVNQDSVQNLVKKLSKNQHILFPNTNSGYGQTEGDKMVTEQDVLNPISVYGTTKVEAEKAVLDHTNRTVFRLATVFGPSPRMRFDLMVNNFVLKLAHDRKIEIFEPHFKRNFVHVKDVARAFYFAIDEGMQGVYNVGLPQANLSKLELAYLTAGLLGMYPPDVVTVGEGADPDKRNYLVSNEKLLKTGFQFEYELDQGILDVAGMLSLLNPTIVNSMKNF